MVFFSGQSRSIKGSAHACGVKQVNGGLVLGGFYKSHLVRVRAFIGHATPFFLVHEHGFVGQLQPHSTGFFVLQPQSACAGGHGVHAVTEAIAPH
jgi:hypothetical protein